jgi:hypothetical protein
MPQEDFRRPFSREGAKAQRRPMRDEGVASPNHSLHDWAILTVKYLG